MWWHLLLEGCAVVLGPPQHGLKRCHSGVVNHGWGVVTIHIRRRVRVVWLRLLWLWSAFLLTKELPQISLFCIVRGGSSLGSLGALRHHWLSLIARQKQCVS